MKNLKDVEKTRIQYHRDPTANTVHRSSLIVPEIAGAQAEIAFLNHFLLKRGYPSVACRITAIDPEGAPIVARLHPVTEPRVYRFRLTGSVPGPVASWIVEFFAAENLFIPFPAVMINHRGEGFLNTVHAFNRALNDVFEDDAINADQRPEASIDVDLTPGRDTFAIFAAGPFRCQGEVVLDLSSSGERRRAAVPVDVPRFGHREISLREAFPDLPARAGGVLRIQQPAQPLFYGRMLAGVRTDAGEFSANHSYYDCSGHGEYWEDDRPSYRTYPRLPSFGAVVRMYPVQSPGRLRIHADFQDASGRKIASGEAGEIASPGDRFLEVDLDALARRSGADPEGVSSFTMRADPLDGRVPTRANHQLSFGRGGLSSSINLSLMNPNTFRPGGKSGRTWGQIPVGGGVRSMAAVVGDDPSGPESGVEIAVFGERGPLGEVRRRLPAGGAVVLDPLVDLPSPPSPGSDLEYRWVMIQSDRPDISYFCVSSDERTAHSTGEHGF